MKIVIDHGQGKREGFYVYVVYDPRSDKNCPIYVGKGTRKRVYNHMRTTHNSHLFGMLTSCYKLALDVRVKIFYVESEEEAFALEKKLIIEYGRSDLGTGTLYNLTDGGEGTIGIVANSEVRKARSKRMREYNADPEFKKGVSEGRRKFHAKPEVAEATAKHMRELHTNPEFAEAHAERAKERMHKLHTNPEFAKATAERMRKRNADPEFLKARSEHMRKLWANPEFAKATAKRARERQHKLWADPEYVKASAERARKQHADFEFAKANAERMRNRRTDPEFIRKLQEGRQRYYAARRAIKEDTI